MATSVDEITELLDSLSIKVRDRLQDGVTTWWNMDNYRSPSGEASLEITIRLLENGEFLVVRAPNLFRLDGRNDAPICKVCLMLQRVHKLVRFEVDGNDGEVAASIPVPIEDATLTEKQLNRCIRGLKRLVDDYYPALDAARTRGEIDPDLLAVETDVIAERLAGALTPEVLETALGLAKARCSMASAAGESAGGTPSVRP